jgi:hypothetical protein
LCHLYIKCIVLPRQARDKHRENASFAAIFALKRSFYQDRLGTNIEKALKKRVAFCDSRLHRLSSFVSKARSQPLQPWTEVRCSYLLICDPPSPGLFELFRLRVCVKMPTLPRQANAGIRVERKKAVSSFLLSNWLCAGIGGCFLLTVDEELSCRSSSPVWDCNDDCLTQQHTSQYHDAPADTARLACNKMCFEECVEGLHKTVW